MWNKISYSRTYCSLLVSRLKLGRNYCHTLPCAQLPFALVRSCVGNAPATWHRSLIYVLQKNWTCHAWNRHGEFPGSHFVAHNLDTSNCASIAYHHQQPLTSSQQFQWKVARHAKRFSEKDRWHILAQIMWAHRFLQLLQTLASHHRHKQNK